MTGRASRSRSSHHSATLASDRLALPRLIVTLTRVAVILNTKPRLKMISGELPEPRTTRSRSWLPYAIVLWILAVVVGHGILYQWLPLMSRHAGLTPDSGMLAASGPEPRAVARATSSEPGAAPRVMMPSVERAPAPDPSKLPSCESIRLDPQASLDQGLPLPVDLSRTPLGNLLDYPRWTTSCRGPRATRVHLCLAVKNGVILGATARADPRDAGIERCIVRAVSTVPLVSEDLLRKVQLDVDVPADRTM